MTGRKVAVIGGGLAGMAAAVALRDEDFSVTLFEARRHLGGRASSFADPETGELVDFCQHVSMSCCTNLVDFCRRVGIVDEFTRHRTLNFVSPLGKLYALQASRWLPAPLHLAPAMLRLGFLSWGERRSLCRALFRLARTDPQSLSGKTIADWLAGQEQSPTVIEHFWNVVLVSALAETLDRVSAAAARKVFVDGFLRNRSGYEVLIPNLPLGTLYGDRLRQALAHLGVAVRLGTTARARGPWPLEILCDAGAESFDYVVLATAWRSLRSVVEKQLLAELPELDAVMDFPTAPITGVHLWFDRAITDLPHAVLVGRLSQWLFARPAETSRVAEEHYYQVVVSASHDMPGQGAAAIARLVIEDLQAVFPTVAAARLLRFRVVTERAAVFSPTPEVEAARPTQRTTLPAVVLAGDWTATGWPATMEGAVRSGYLAAEAILNSAGQGRKFLVDDLSTGWLARRALRCAATP